MTMTMSTLTTNAHQKILFYLFSIIFFYYIIFLILEIVHENEILFLKTVKIVFICEMFRAIVVVVAKFSFIHSVFFCTKICVCDEGRFNIESARNGKRKGEKYKANDINQNNNNNKKVKRRTSEEKYNLLLVVSSAERVSE
jgi:hypothetical protein